LKNALKRIIVVSGDVMDTLFKDFLNTILFNHHPSEKILAGN